MRWNGILAPARTPPQTVDRLNRAIVTAVAAPDVQARLASQGAEASTSSPGEFVAYIDSEIAKYAKVVAFAGIPKE